MTKSATPVQKPPNSETSKKACCPLKKMISYSCKVWSMITVCLLLVAAAVVLVYVLLTKNTGGPENILALPKKSNWSPDCPGRLLDPNERYDCYPDDAFVGETACKSRGCCYVGNLSSEEANRTTLDRMPRCVYPINYGYISSGRVIPTFNGFELPLERIPAPSRFGDDIHVVHMKVEMQTKYRLRIKFYDPVNNRHEVPVPKVPSHTPTETPGQTAREIFLYSVTYDVHNEPFTIKVRRSNTDAVIFDTSAGALSLANQFLELTTKLPSFNVHGFGQNANKRHHPGFNWDTVRLFSTKPKDKMTSTAHSMYLCLENDGSAHGVLLLNSNAMEVQLHPSPAVTFRTIGGILDFYLFLGPTPEEVIHQYTEAVGRPAIPPYWSLGLHIGQLSYQSIGEIEALIDGFKAKHIPVESIVINSNAMTHFALKNKLDFSNFTSKLKSKAQKLVVRLEAEVSREAVSNRESVYSGSLQKGVFVTDKWGWSPIDGKCHGKAVVYPDWGSYEAISWWSKVLKKISSLFTYDGLWLVNSEPRSSVDGSLSGCLTDDLNSPPYVPGSPAKPIYDKTFCMDALLHWRTDVVTHYDCLNFYGHSMVMATEQAVNLNSPSKRQLLISDSTFIGTGQFAGHSLREHESSWEGLHSSVSVVIELGLNGVAFSGGNMCEGDEELCLRWLQCGIFYPLLQLDQTAAEYLYNTGLTNKDIFKVVRNALSRRYELLPELYTLFYLAHTKGSSVVRPLSHNYPSDNETYAIDSQFMWGSSLLISPVLEKGLKELNFYLPEGIWYDYYQGGVMYSSGEWFAETGGVFEDSKQPAVLHIRSGHIITLQKPAETTTISRQNSMSILVALNSTFQANGLLYWDDGETKNSHLLGEYLLVKYSASWNSLNVTGHFGKRVFKSSFYKAAIEQVRIMGLSKPPKRIIIDGSYILSNKQYHWNIDTMVLDLKLILIPLGRRTEIIWYY